MCVGIGLLVLLVMSNMNVNMWLNTLPVVMSSDLRRDRWSPEEPSLSINSLPVLSRLSKPKFVS